MIKRKRIQKKRKTRSQVPTINQVCLKQSNSNQQVQSVQDGRETRNETTIVPNRKTIIYRCDRCKQDFLSTYQLGGHIQKVHRNKPPGVSILEKTLRKIPKYV